jgi:hypothetical protein
VGVRKGVDQGAWGWIWLSVQNALDLVFGVGILLSCNALPQRFLLWPMCGVGSLLRTRQQLLRRADHCLVGRQTKNKGD